MQQTTTPPPTDKFGNLQPGQTFEWVVPIGQGGVQKHVVTYESVLRAANQPTAQHVARFPLDRSSVLLVHGEQDTVVPPQDAHKILQTLRQRQGELEGNSGGGGMATPPTRVTLHLVPNADHNFLNVLTDQPITMFDDLVTCIKGWYTSLAGTTGTAPFSL